MRTVYFFFIAGLHAQELLIERRIVEEIYEKSKKIEKASHFFKQGLFVSMIEHTSIRTHLSILASTPVVLFVENVIYVAFIQFTVLYLRSFLVSLPFSIHLFANFLLPPLLKQR